MTEQEYLDLKYQIVVLVANEVAWQHDIDEKELDYSAIECEISKELDELLKGLQK